MSDVVAEREYTTIDKAGWGDGPWHDEPDKVQWVDEATGLDCLIVRNRLGALCGYVGVPSGHPAHGQDYDKVRVNQRDPDDEWSDWPDVHGGLTYAASCDEGAPEDRGICHVPLEGRPVDVWWLGFDCAHSGDIVPGMDATSRALGHPPLRCGDERYCTVEYVRRECESLAHQLVQ